MRHFFVTLVLFLGFTGSIFSQTATVRGVVKDANSGELLEGVNIVQPPSNGTHTDISGNYELKVPAGDVVLIYSYLGLTTDTVHFNIKAGAEKQLNIGLKGSGQEIGTIVVSESRVGQKLQTVTQSVDVLSPRLIQASNVTNMQAAVTKVPGVTVLDGQISVRGGSGYAYGAGSRVTLVVDGMPLMTADRQDIKWPFVPIENVAQLEILKGAASVQYGASALNGVMNVNTDYPADTPTTRLSFYYEGFGNPPVDSFKWWKRDGKFFSCPNRIGMNFLHMQKIGDVDIVFSGMLNGFQSYLQYDYDYYTRFNGKIRWRPHKASRLTLELAASTLYDNNGFQFYWTDAGHPYVGNTGVLNDQRFFYGYLDTKITYIDKIGDEHDIWGRFYRQKLLGQGSLSEFWVSSVFYNFRHDFGKLFMLRAGVNNDHYKMADGDLGKHVGDYGGGFIQGRLSYDFLTVNVGAREEYIREDTVIKPTVPVFNIGASFEIRKYNNIRISFSQSFRWPSIAERYVDYTLSGVQILPNTSLKPERGFTSELGYKRTLKIGSWTGFFDASVFLTRFKDMIEFTFDSRSLPSPPFFQPYFQSQNIAKAQIFGWELSLSGHGHLSPNVDVETMIGYTYFYGVNLNDTTGPNNSNFGSFLKNAFTHYVLPTAKSEYIWDSLTAGMLKYRNPHQFKADIDFIFFKKYHLGTSMQYYSYMTRIDGVFAIQVPGIGDYRTQRRNKGDFFWDLRTGVDFNRNISLNFIVKNVLNNYTVFRIARPDPPRSFTVQVVVNFGGMNKRGTTITPPAAGM